jgi:hypothetical protein
VVRRELDEQFFFVLADDVDTDPFVLVEVDLVSSFLFFNSSFLGCLRCFCFDDSLLLRYVIEGFAHDEGEEEVDLVGAEEEVDSVTVVPMFVEDGDEEAVEIDEGEVRDEPEVDPVDRFSFV